MRISDSLEVHRRRALQNVLNQSPAKCLSKSKQSAMAISFKSIDLASREIKTKVQRVVARRLLQAPGIAKRVLRSIQRHARGGSD